MKNLQLEPEFFGLRNAMEVIRVDYIKKSLISLSLMFVDAA